MEIKMSWFKHTPKIKELPKPSPHRPHHYSKNQEKPQPTQQPKP